MDNFVAYSCMFSMLLFAGLIMMFGADNVIDKEFVSQNPIIAMIVIIPLVFYKPKSKRRE